MVSSSPLKFSFNLPIVAEQSNFQKCLIPAEKFPLGIIAGSTCICTTNSGRYVCDVYPAANRYPRSLCIIDRSVSLDRIAEENTKDDRLIAIEQISTLTAPFQMVSIRISLNGNIFRNAELNRTNLTRIARIFLSVFIFSTTSVIDMTEEAKEFGIEIVEIVSASGNCILGKIDDNTEFCLDDIRLVGSATKLMPNSGAWFADNETELLRICTDCSESDRFENWLLKPSFNTLIVGSTGCGKTTICHNLIAKNHLNVFEAQTNELISSLPGETEKKLRDIFDNAKQFVRNFQPKKLTIVLIENIELLCPAETTSSEKSHINRITYQLLSLFDDLHLNGTGILVIATTSNLDIVNNAIRRPGRLENEIFIHSLSEKRRGDILNLLIQKEFALRASEADELACWLAIRTAGFVAADLVALINFVHRRKFELTVCATENVIEEYKNLFADGLRSVKPTSLRGTDVSVISTYLTFNDIGGMNDLKRSLIISILSPLRNPERFRKFNLEPPKGVLLYGPPGCAKTMIAKCLANEANMTFISTSGAEIYSPYVGNAEKFILKIFNTARRNTPCLIFLDEIDALVGNRQSGSGSDVQTRVLSALLIEIDGIGNKIQSALNSAENRILIVGATNRPDIIDSALMRPGRFDRLIHVSAPDQLSRLKILELYQKKMPFSNDVDLEQIAKETENFSGADLCNLCNEAALETMTRNFDLETIDRIDFERVLSRMKPSLTEEQLKWYKNFEKCYVK